MKQYDSAEDIIEEARPEQSVYCFRPHVVSRMANWFGRNFPGNILYSVKSNPAPEVLKILWESGIKRYDVASIFEAEHVAKTIPGAKMFFMHTVKNRSAISRAYFEFGIRDFSLDSHEELEKILEQTNDATDLNLYVRLAVPNLHAELSLSGKFGIQIEDAHKLLKATRKVANKLGICFHVGSQCMHPDAYAAAITIANKLVRKHKIHLDVLDIGGGFPSIYPGMTPPPLENYMQRISEAAKQLSNGHVVELWCEPGRAMVAESGSLIVKVELRKGNMLYINDGVYGSLFDAGTPNFLYPMKLIRINGTPSETTMPFGFYGPTCDSIDVMKGPFYLPDDVQEGDYIEIGQLGAYGRTMQTNFNGFASTQQVTLRDEPLMSVFKRDEVEPEQLRISI